MDSHRRPVLLIAKRNGVREPFDARKLGRCLAVVMQHCGYEKKYAAALAQAVEMHLSHWSESQPPSSDYIFQCVRTVLSETGLGDVARQLVAHRRERAARRQRLHVWDVRPSRSGQSIRWSKAAVAATFERTYGMRPPSARILAGEVECRLLSLQYMDISSTLVAELMRCELLAWGIDGEREPGRTQGKKVNLPERPT